MCNHPSSSVPPGVNAFNCSSAGLLEARNARHTVSRPHVRIMDYGLRNGYSCRHTTARSARYQQLWQSLDKEYICLHAKLIPHRCRYKYLDTYLAGQLVPYTCQPEADPNRDGTLFLSSGQPLTRLHSRARSKAAERGYACRVVFCTVLFSFCREIPTESACCSRPPAMHVARLMQYPRAESVRPGCFQA